MGQSCHGRAYLDRNGIPRCFGGRVFGMGGLTSASKPVFTTENTENTENTEVHGEEKLALRAQRYWTQLRHRLWPSGIVIEQRRL